MFVAGYAFNLRRNKFAKHEISQIYLLAKKEKRIASSSRK